MWDIYEHRNAVKQLQSLPIDVLKRYEKWKDVIYKIEKNLVLVQGVKVPAHD